MERQGIAEDTGRGYGERRRNMRLLTVRPLEPGEVFEDTVFADPGEGALETYPGLTAVFLHTFQRNMS